MMLILKTRKKKLLHFISDKILQMYKLYKYLNCINI